MTLRKTVQSFFPKGMVTFLPVPEVSLSNITSLRKTLIFEIETSLIYAEFSVNQLRHNPV